MTATIICKIPFSIKERIIVKQHLTSVKFAFIDIIYASRNICIPFQRMSFVVTEYFRSIQLKSVYFIIFFWTFLKSVWLEVIPFQKNKRFLILE